jgi:hypothetical protein
MRDVDLVDRLADEDPGGADAGAGLALAVEDRDRKSARGRRPRRRETGEARPDYRYIEMHVTRPEVGARIKEFDCGRISAATMRFPAN